MPSRQISLPNDASRNPVKSAGWIVGNVDIPIIYDGFLLKIPKVVAEPTHLKKYARQVGSSSRKTNE